MTLILEQSAEGVYLSVHLQPRAAKNEIVGISDAGLKIKVTEPASEDRANKALIFFLAKRLGLAKSAITIVAGVHSRHKRLFFQGVEKDLLSELLVK